MTDRKTRLTLRGRRGAHWYGDGDPQWTQGKRGRPCQTAEQALAERRKAIKLLKRHGGTDPRANRVRVRLESCTSKRRCLSGACPECQRAYQRWFVTSANRFLNQAKKRFRIASVVPKSKIDRGNLR